MACAPWAHGPRIRLPASWLAAPVTLWRFSRPHTLVGTTVSILGIYAIAAAELPGVALGDGIGDLALTLLAGAAVNIYIVGLNQCEDVEIDRINKPWLPIAGWPPRPARGLAAGDRQRRARCRPGRYAGLGRGRGRSRSARHRHGLLLPASAPQALPRCSGGQHLHRTACVVNVGVYLHFASSLGGRGELSPLPGPIIALTLFVLPFSFAIAVLKDVPDAEGDRRFRIATFTVRLGPSAAFKIGMAALTAGYLGMAVLGPL